VFELSVTTFCPDQSPTVVFKRAVGPLASCIRCAYASSVTFGWDDEKRRLNLRKHRIDLADAVSVFEDEFALTAADTDIDEEDRFVSLGSDLFGRLLVVAYTWRGDTIRMISARKATRRERMQYGEHR
jgi:uncharacterized DUF497 family protein